MLKRKVQSKSLNDKLSAKEIKVDLNNRLAFVKHLLQRQYGRLQSGIVPIEYHR